jgi:hypothetical protein|tara:strand:+ start:398 stop:622 length:225 start_codon:yes stop_codon:yes gene_type:complete
MSTKFYKVTLHDQYRGSFEVKGYYSTNDLATEACKLWEEYSKDEYYHVYRTDEVELDPPLGKIPTLTDREYVND